MATKKAVTKAPAIPSGWALGYIHEKELHISSEIYPTREKLHGAESLDDYDDGDVIIEMRVVGRLKKSQVIIEDIK